MKRGEFCLNCLDVKVHAKNLCNACYHSQHYYKDKTSKTKCNLKWSRTIKGRYSKLKYGAKETKTTTDISFDEYVNLLESAKNLCIYCNETVLSNYGYCLDRIDNNKSYTLNNVLVCCTSCNKTRGDRWSVEETKVMIDAVIKFRKENS